MSIIFDLMSMESCLKFLSEFTQKNEDSITEFLNKQECYPSDFDEVIDDFLTELNINLEELNIDNIIISGIHVTTNHDNCESIKKFGILNLQQALTMDTHLRRFLMERGFQVDFRNGYIICTKNDGSKAIFNFEEFNGLLQNKSLIITKLTSKNHYPINAFLSIKDYKSYGGNVHEIPEFVRDFSESFGQAITKEWAESRKAYAIKFHVDFHTCHCSTFGLEDADYVEDIENNYIETKRRLLRLCMESYILMNNDVAREEKLLFLEHMAYVPFKDIYAIVDLETNENI